MKYRSQECQPRPFSDETGTGTEYLLDGVIVIREHKICIIPPEEKAKQEEAARITAEQSTLAKRKQIALEIAAEKIEATDKAAIDARMSIKPIVIDQLKEG
jgi:hypothetical protein